MNEIVLPTRARGSPELLSVSTASNSEGGSSVQKVDQSDIPLDSPRDVLQILKSKPDIHGLERCLAYLEEAHADELSRANFHVKALSPLASQIVFVLVNDTVPSYWPLLSTEKSLRPTWLLLIRCLKGIAGIKATCTRLRALCRSSQDQGDRKIPGSMHENLKIDLQLLECLLHGEKTLGAIWKDVCEYESTESRRLMVMDDLSSSVAGGSSLAAAAEATAKLNETSIRVENQSWAGDGRQYATWLGRNLLSWSKEIAQDRSADTTKVRDRFVSRSLSLGFNDQIVEILFQGLMEGNTDNLVLCRGILNGLNDGLQRTVLNVLLHLLSLRAKGGTSEKTVAGIAALVHELLEGNDRLQHYLVNWLSEFSGGNVTFDTSLFQAVIASLSTNVESLKKAHTECLIRFGSKQHIKRDPLLQQEKQTQVLLLTTGLLCKIDPQFIKDMKHSSIYLDAISNRLGASSSRGQFLGMVTGMTVSSLLEEGENRLIFSNPDIDSTEGKFYQDLINFDDRIGKISDIKFGFEGPITALPKPENMIAKDKKPLPSKSTDSRSKIIAIEELSDSDDEDDLPVYAKPDSDPEDEDDDPTLINRNKPTAPVYIRDLLAGLRDDDNNERHALALETAAGLIRRKTDFGTEVSDHIEELATVIVGMKDDAIIDSERFQELRLRAMVAVVVARPDEMGPWFANTFFNGDYSISQRAGILTAIALSARELAGLGDEDASLTGTADTPAFPSKRLPSHLEAAFSAHHQSSLPSLSSSSPSSRSRLAAITAAQPITRLSGRQEGAILQPLALSAADAATGPNALKVRTFSSRLDPAKQAARTRTVPNRLARRVADAFFFPLTARWRSVLRARAHASVFSAEPFLLATLLRTLALLLGAAGPGTLSVRDTTAEFWALLLGLRARALPGGRAGGGGGGAKEGKGEEEDGGGELPVVEALLFGFLTLLDLNAGQPEMVARDFAEELVETRTWVDAVLENTRGGSREEERVRVLAAGVMVKAEGIVEKYRKQLLGNMPGLD